MFLSDALAANVRALRARNRWSQDHLAERMGWLGHDWTRATVSEVERSGRTVSLDEFFALALALGARPTEIVWPDRAHVDLGSEAHPVHPNFVAMWLSGRMRVSVNPDDHASFLIDLAADDEEASPRRHATIAEMKAMFGDRTGDEDNR